MGEDERTTDLHSRAMALIEGPCCVSKEEDYPSVLEIVGRYIEGKPWGVGDLSRCIRYALERAAGAEMATGSERDARHFYKRAAVILLEIQTELSARRR